jgi:dipeptide/tripeptide permease
VIGWVIGAIVSGLLVIVVSVTTTLASESFRAQMMALHFFSVGLGTSMSGVHKSTPVSAWPSRDRARNRNCAQAR